LEDGTLVLYSPSGRRLNSFSLDSPCARVDGNGEYLVAISASGILYRWNAVSQDQLSPPISILSILSSGSLSQGHKLGEGENLVSLRVHSNGQPIIHTKAEMAYSLDSKTQTLTCVSQGWFMDYSDCWDSQQMEIDGVSSSIDSTSRPVRFIESEISKLVKARASTGIKPASSSPTGEKGDLFRNAVAVRHCEARLNAALLLESSQEYEAFLLDYVTLLSEKKLTNQARELIQELMGPAYR